MQAFTERESRSEYGVHVQLRIELGMEHILWGTRI